jgi:2-desacetyl-2-hydroxyethyl bacteriochlorophyllide A dehydrogenase
MIGSMQAIVLEQPGRLRRASVADLPAPPEGLALVRVHCIGVCGTDFHAFRGSQPFFDYPRILGHELAVEVLAVGSPDDRIRIGDRCAVEPYMNCGTCAMCRLGRTNCCGSLRVLGVHIDGGMQQHLHVPLAKLHPSSSIGLEELALVETLGIGAHAVQRAQVAHGEWVFVIGAGPIGLGLVQFATLAGAHVIVGDVSPSRLEACGSQFPKIQTVDMRGEDVLQRVRQIAGAEGTAVVADATGSAASMARAFDFPAQGGRIVFVGICQADVSFADPAFHRRELTVYASRNAVAADFTRIIGLLETRQIDVGRWITHRAALDELPDVFPTWLEPGAGVVKPIVEVS